MSRKVRWLKSETAVVTAKDCVIMHGGEQLRAHDFRKLAISSFREFLTWNLLSSCSRAFSTISALAGEVQYEAGVASCV